MLVVQTLHVHRSVRWRVLIICFSSAAAIAIHRPLSLPPFPYTYETFRLPSNLDDRHHGSVMARLPLARQSPPVISNFWSSTVFSVGGYPTGGGLGNAQLFVCSFALADCSAVDLKVRMMFLPVPSPVKTVLLRVSLVCQHHQLNNLQ